MRVLWLVVPAVVVTGRGAVQRLLLPEDFHSVPQHRRTGKASRWGDHMPLQEAGTLASLPQASVLILGASSLCPCSAVPPHQVSGLPQGLGWACASSLPTPAMLGPMSQASEGWLPACCSFCWGRAGRTGSPRLSPPWSQGGAQPATACPECHGLRHEASEPPTSSDLC